MRTIRASIAVVLSLVPTLVAATPVGAAVSIETRAARARGPQWGMMGGWSGVSLSDLRDRGVRVVDLSLEWRSAEPQRGRWDEGYFAAKRDEIRGLRREGFRIVLNYGLHHAPDWLLDRRGGRFENQFGDVYRGSDEPNLVWADQRALGEARRYTAKVFRELGERFVAVRVGGGHWGELTYPELFDGSGRSVQSYWAFDPSALRESPVPTWRPCDASPNGQARRFLNWYLDSLTRYQNRQVDWIRQAGFRGTVAVLYASWGMRNGDFREAVDANLCGTSSPEINGEVQRGFDHARHIAGLRDRNAAVWGTWAEQDGTISWLARLADRYGHGVMAENAGSDDVSAMRTTVGVARRQRIDLLMWVRAEEAYCGCNGYATIDDYERLIDG